MAYNKPFEKRSPDYRRVSYEFVYEDEEAASKAFVLLKNKRYTLTNTGDYVLPVGHRIHSCEEMLTGKTVSFVGKVKASEFPDSANIIDMEREISGNNGRIVSKAIIQ